MSTAHRQAGVWAASILAIGLVIGLGVLLADPIHSPAPRGELETLSCADVDWRNPSRHHSARRDWAKRGACRESRQESRAGRAWLRSWVAGFPIESPEAQRVQQEPVRSILKQRVPDHVHQKCVYGVVVFERTHSRVEPPRQSPSRHYFAEAPGIGIG